MTSGRCGFCHIFVSVVAFAACRDTPAARNADSASAAQRLIPPVTGLAGKTGWDSAAGPLIIVPVSRSATDVAIVLPGLTDSTLAATSRFELRGLENLPVELFSPRGQVGSSRLQVSSQSSDLTGCINWPTGKLADPIAGRWRVALEKGRAVGLPLDSVEGMTSSDSAQFVADVVKAALSLTDAEDPAFREIPFFVRKGYRFSTPTSSVVIAEVVRRINEEANPREEHLLLLAERPEGNARYRVAFRARSAGPEESLETSEVLAALRLTKSNREAVVITFDFEDGGEIGLLERAAANDWRVVWRSAYTGC